MPSNEWPKQLNPDSVVPGDAMSEEQTFRSGVNQKSSIRSKSSNRSKRFVRQSPPQDGSAPTFMAETDQPQIVWLKRLQRQERFEPTVVQIGGRSHS
jgi:hypothetical protein